MAQSQNWSCSRYDWIAHPRGWRWGGRGGRGVEPLVNDRVFPWQNLLTSEQAFGHFGHEECHVHRLGGIDFDCVPLLRVLLNDLFRRAPSHNHGSKTNATRGYSALTHARHHTRRVPGSATRRLFNRGHDLLKHSTVAQSTHLRALCLSLRLWTTQGGTRQTGGGGGLTKIIHTVFVSFTSGTGAGAGALTGAGAGVESAKGRTLAWTGVEKHVMRHASKPMIHSSNAG